MSENFNEILYCVLEESLESLAFMFAESIDTSEVAMTDTECVKVFMEFKGDLYSGSLMMIVPSNISSELAANILGIDDDSADAMELGDDSLKEVLNVICGRVLTEISGTEPLFDLSIPETERIPCSDLSQFVSDQNTCSAMIDDLYPIILQFKKY